MFAIDDTIVALATPPGRGGIGVVRIGGAQAQTIARAILARREPLEPRMATLTRVRTASHAAPGGVADEVVATLFPAPHSYTGQDVVEISGHGSPVVLHAIVRSAIAAGARLAEPGEFTLRAFLNGKRDLVQAEAVADLVDAATPLQARVAFDQLDGTLTRRIADIDAELFGLIARLEASLDFPEEGYHFVDPAETAGTLTEVLKRLTGLLGESARGRLIREGVTVVIVGRPNVGKSSIFNKLSGSDRAIVTEVPGTTRDLITERVDIEGLAVTLVDTAGARETSDIVEREGVSRGAQARRVADLLLVILDLTEPLNRDDDQLLAQTAESRRLVIANKADLRRHLEFPGAINVSAATGEGMADLRHAIVQELTSGESLRDTVAISNLRHIHLLEQARDHLARARDAVVAGTPEEFILTDLQGARGRFDEVVGTRTTDDVLQHIFERFCIGK